MRVWMHGEMNVCMDAWMDKRMNVKIGCEKVVEILMLR